VQDLPYNFTLDLLFTNLGRLITIAQAVWFSVNCIFRFAQGVFVTTLELTTLSFILVFLLTSYCWFYKPMDVNRPITLKLNCPVETIRNHHHQGPGSKWYGTPLDFLSRDEWFIMRFLKYYIQLIHHLRIPLVTQPKRRPYDRLPSYYAPRPDTLADMIGALAILLYSSIFLIAWNSHFPTATEKLLWRIASGTVLAYAVVGGFTELYFNKTMFRAKSAQERAQAILKQKRDPKGRIGRLATKLRNLDPSQDPELEIPIRALVPVSILCASYCMGRGLILTEDLIGLRSLPESAFQTVSWSKYVPHW
jgi:uncharacterized membrane protein YsdA (DUF1294 family)